MQREFITVSDNTLPARLTSCVGITTAYEPTTDRSQSGYFYQTSYAVCAIEPIVAFQVRFLLFNVWNAYVRALTSTQISDICVEKIHHHKDRWHLENKNETVEHFATVSFIAAVRTVDGQVYHTDTRPIANAVRDLSGTFDEAIVNQVTF